MPNRSSFTLIELLVVIAILAVLSVAVVFIINPSDIIKQSRDTNRLTDLNNLNKALGIFDVTNPNDFTGTSSIIYVSLSDTSGTCANLGLPSLPGGYAYRCVTSSTLTKIDGTGWIPINFASVSYGSPIQRLPIDPVNTSTTGEYYSYVTGGSWELNAILSSNKYRNDDDITKTNLPGVLSIGSDKTLNPVYTTNGLVGYWKFDEGTGSVAVDSSNNGNSGTLISSPTWQSEGNCKVKQCLNFDGSSKRVLLTTPFGQSGSSTISLWYKNSSSGATSWRTLLGATSSNIHHLIVQTPGNGPIGIFDGSFRSFGYTPPNDNLFHNYTVIYNSAATAILYVDGIYVNQIAIILDLTTYPIGSIGNWGSGSYQAGPIDDVRIYNRVLSAAEILAIYNSTR
ncbi:MAG: LamG-like jellyroll fold domain-containing protein [bacterium]|nr:LamG-like jellyroll fold domain-containing protein [bacterium]